MQMLPGDIWAFYEGEAGHPGAWPTRESILSLKWAEPFLRVNCLCPCWNAGLNPWSIVLFSQASQECGFLKCEIPQTSI